MNIPKAIEILTINNDHNPAYTDTDRYNAHQLGIEALKHEKRFRIMHPIYNEGLLPGETDE